MPADLVLISAAFRFGNYIMRNHAYTEMLNEDITIEFLEEAIGRDVPKIIENWRGGCLVLGWGTPSEPVHAVIGLGRDPTNYRLVTVYRPDKKPRLWTRNYEKRRRTNYQIQ